MTNACRLPMLATFAVLIAFFVADIALAQPQQTAKKGALADGPLIELNEDNWQLMLSGEWMIEFFAPWCPACKNLAPTWERYAKTAKEVGVNVAKIDVTTSPSLSGRFFVTALPTIYHVKDGEFRQYRGSRDGDALLFFIKKQQWQKFEPLSAWKKPDTIHMSVLSYFFKLSHTLKDFNARLQDEYGLPPWGSYALFAVATIFVGAALGLLLVCIVDFVYPPKKSQRQSFAENRSAGIEDLATDDLEDDIQNEETETNDDEDDEEQEEDDEEDVDEVVDEDTSDGEKNSNSESEAEADASAKAKAKESIGDAATAKTMKINADEHEPAATPDEEDSSTAKTEVRKRKPRKAD